jgi:hypothetical protein
MQPSLAALFPIPRPTYPKSVVKGLDQKYKVSLNHDNNCCQKHMQFLNTYLFWHLVASSGILHCAHHDHNYSY